MLTTICTAEGLGNDVGCRALRETEELQSIPISVDTFDAEVAAQAVAAGAHMVNDVSGGTMDPHMHAQVPSVLWYYCCTAARLALVLAGCMGYTHLPPHAYSCL